MTAYDRAKLAKIAAFQLEMNRSPAAVESFLWSVAPGADPVDIDRAMREGDKAREIAAGLTLGFSEATAGLMGGLSGGAEQRWDVLIHFHEAVGGGREWRSTTFSAPAGATPDEIRTLAQEKMAAIEQARASAGRRPGDTWYGEIMMGTLEFGYAVPILPE